MKRLYPFFLLLGLAAVVALSGCSSVADAYDAAEGRYTSVTNKVGQGRGIIQDTRSVGKRAKEYGKGE